MEGLKVEPATIHDLDVLTQLLVDLFEQEHDFRPAPQKHQRAIRLILENPSRGRIFVLRNHGRVLGMINLLVTISTAEGGFAMLLEDLIIHRDFRGQGLGSRLLQFAIDYAREKDFVRITLLTDRDDALSQEFYTKHGFSVSQMLPMRLILERPANGA